HPLGRQPSSREFAQLREQPPALLLGAELADVDALRSRPPKLLSQARGAAQLFVPLRGIPHGLLAHDQRVELSFHLPEKALFRGEEAASPPRLTCGFHEGLARLAESILAGDGGAR